MVGGPGVVWLLALLLLLLLHVIYVTHPYRFDALSSQGEGAVPSGVPPRL